MSSRNDPGLESNPVPNDPGSEPSNGRWESIDDPGEFGPGCSVPICIGESEKSYYFAFGNHEPWQPDTPTKKQQECLLMDMVLVLQGLHALHQRQLYYGRISGKTFCQRGDVASRKPLVHVDPRLVSSSADVTGGHREEKYWHHDRIRKPRKAKATDDLYSLGVVLAEALLQPDHVDSIWSSLSDKADFPKMLIRDLKSKKANGYLKKLVYWLLQSPDHPKRTASDAIACLQQVRLRKRVVIAMGIATFSLIVAAIVFSVAQWEFAGLTKDVESLNRQLNEAIEDVKNRDKKISDLKSEVARLNKIFDGLRPQEPIDPEAEKLWVEKIAGGGIDEVIAEAKEFLQTDPAENVARKIQAWRDRLESLKKKSAHISEWYKDDTVLNELLRVATHNPWEENNIKSAQTRTESLNSAYETWSDWANSTKTFDDLCKERDLAPPEEKAILGAWLLEIRQIERLTFRVNGKTNQPYRLEHLLTIASGGLSTNREVWNWKSTTSSGGSKSMTLPSYQSGGEIEFWLEQYGAGYYPNVAHFVYSGPLAPWVLMGDGSSSRNQEYYKSGYSVNVWTTIKVGPPHLSEITKPTAPDDPRPPGPDEPTTPPGWDPADVIGLGGLQQKN